METQPIPLPIFFLSPFKSYYVVWKLLFCFEHHLRVCQFKSYYVVWKPITKEIFAFRPDGLNRTM